MFLADLQQGDRARILSIEGGQGFRHKLLSRGVAEGCVVKVISNSGGPVIVELNRNTIALGMGMAGRILVHRMDGR